MIELNIISTVVQRSLEGRPIPTGGNTIIVQGGGSVDVDAIVKEVKDAIRNDFLSSLNDDEAEGVIDFLNGLKVGGLPISKYKGHDDVIYIDANVVLRGGLTQYAVDPVTIPSIAESLPFDKKTIQYNTTTKLIEVIGGTGGGVADSVAWANITGKPTFATVATSGSYSDLSNKPTIPTSLKSPYALSWSGYSSGSYDGSAAKSITIPSNTNQLTNGAGFITASDNVASATKLKKARTIWGKGFDGTADINGELTYTTNTLSRSAFNHSGDQLIISDCLAETMLRGTAVKFQNSEGTNAMILTGGNLGIGISPAYKLDISGSLRATGNVYLCRDSNYRVGIRTETPEQALDVNGGFQVSGLSHLMGVVYKYNTDKSYRLTFSYNISSDASTAHIYNIANDGSVLGDLRIGNTAGNALVVSANNRVGIGKPVPEYKLDVSGTTRITGAVTLGSTLTGNYWHLNNSSTNPYLRLTRSSVNWYVQLVADGLALGAGLANSCTIDASGNFLSVGGVTQYSDIRKKTKLQDVELTLKQVANAPLIEHYYNNDDKKTTHVGSIAQYWAGLNDWFCKLDSDGYYTMEIQNAALASAISIARELQKYESKTDRTIRLLKKRINQLEDEIEILKKGA